MCLVDTKQISVDFLVWTSHLALPLLPDLSRPQTELCRPGRYQALKQTGSRCMLGLLLSPSASLLEQTKQPPSKAFLKAFRVDSVLKCHEAV